MARSVPHHCSQSPFRHWYCSQPSPDARVATSAPPACPNREKVPENTKRAHVGVYSRKLAVVFFGTYALMNSIVTPVSLILIRVIDRPLATVLGHAETKDFLHVVTHIGAHLLAQSTLFHHNCSLILLMLHMQCFYILFSPYDTVRHLAVDFYFTTNYGMFFMLLHGEDYGGPAVAFVFLVFLIAVKLCSWADLEGKQVEMVRENIRKAQREAEARERERYRLRLEDYRRMRQSIRDTTTELGVPLLQQGH